MPLGFAIPPAIILTIIYGEGRECKKCRADAPNTDRVDFLCSSILVYR